MSFNYNYGIEMPRTGAVWPGMQTQAWGRPGQPCRPDQMSQASQPDQMDQPDRPVRQYPVPDCDAAPLFAAPEAAKEETVTVPAAVPFSPDRFPVGMGYVPVQKWESTYPLNRALKQGTIFPALDLEFMGRCG